MFWRASFDPLMGRMRPAGRVFEDAVLNQHLEQRFSVKVLHIIYLIIMAVPRDALTRIINPNYIYKIYYLMLQVQGNKRTPGLPGHLEVCQRDQVGPQVFGSFNHRWTHFGHPPFLRTDSGSKESDRFPTTEFNPWAHGEFE